MFTFTFIHTPRQGDFILRVPNKMKTYAMPSNM